VRLTSNDEDLEYAWQINDASLEIVFRKNLSKHSVGVYMRLSPEVGLSFRAIPPRKVRKVRNTLSSSSSTTSWTDHRQFASPGPNLAEQLQTLRAENALLLERLGHAEGRANARALLDFDTQIEMLRSVIRDAQMVIHAHQRLVENML
jgi:hypothetical protein